MKKKKHQQTTDWKNSVCPVFLKAAVLKRPVCLVADPLIEVF